MHEHDARVGGIHVGAELVGHHEGVGKGQACRHAQGLGVWGRTRHSLFTGLCLL